MPIELDKGLDEPLFGPEGKLNLARRLAIAREIIRKYGRRATRTSSIGRVRTGASLVITRARRGRRPKRK
jgi:hypothetical protein